MMNYCTDHDRNVISTSTLQLTCSRWLSRTLQVSWQVKPGQWRVQLSWMFEFLHKLPIGNASDGSGLQSLWEKCTKWIRGDTLNERGGFVCVQIIIQLISGAVTAKQNSGGLESSMTPSDCEYSCLSYHTEHVHYFYFFLEILPHGWILCFNYLF